MTTRTFDIDMKFTETRRTKVAIEFPVYSKHHLDSSIIYRVLMADLTLVSITEYDEPERCEIEISDLSLADIGREPDYFLGKGEYASSKDEFWVVAEALCGRVGTVMGRMREDAAEQDKGEPAP